MIYTDDLSIIRTFLRDPDSSIWSNEYLRLLYNAGQQSMQQNFRMLTKIEAIDTPPKYECSYLFDWELSYAPTGAAKRALNYHVQSGISASQPWELILISSSSYTATSRGAYYTHTFEAWQGSPAEYPAFPLPHGFEEMKFIAYDRKSIYAIDYKTVQNGDPSWMTRTGEPFAYYRKDALSNEFYPYPMPDSALNSNISGGQFPMVTFIDGDTLSQEPGDMADRDDTFFTQDIGVSIDAVVYDENFLMVYSKRPTDIESLDDESDYPVYMRKYLRYGVISDAYSANTDGRIKSLGDYWAWRRDIGYLMLGKFFAKRKQDRDYCFTTHLSRQKGSMSRHPRLPDTYPDVYP